MSEKVCLGVTVSPDELTSISMGTQCEVRVRMKPYWANRLVHSEPRGKPILFNSYDSVVITSTSDRRESVECGFVSISIELKRTADIGNGGSSYVIHLGSIISRNGVSIFERLIPGTYAQEFTRKFPEKSSLDEIEETLESFAYYVIPVTGSEGNPHRKQVEVFCNMYSDEIKCVDRIVTLEAFTNFICRMSSFSVGELFRTQAVERVF